MCHPHKTIISNFLLTDGETDFFNIIFYDLFFNISEGITGSTVPGLCVLFIR